MRWTRVPARLGPLARLLAHQPYRQLPHIDGLVLIAVLLSCVLLSASYGSKPVASSTAGWDHVVDLLLSDFHLVGVVEEAGFGSCFVLGVVEGALFHGRLVGGHVCVGSCACCDSSHMCRVGAFTLHSPWLCNCLIQVHH